MTKNRDPRRIQQWYDQKTEWMVAALGKQHDVVLHAIVAYACGGPLDLYYFPHGIPGTAIATKELCEIPGEGSRNHMFDNYELVMFTRHEMSLDDADDASTPFGLAHRSISGILNRIARFSAEATLNIHNTCEIPEDDEIETIAGKCLIFDAYGPRPAHAEFGLLAILEIHPSEMNYARKQGGQKLIAKLKGAGHYPYSDLDRPAVV